MTGRPWVILPACSYGFISERRSRLHFVVCGYDNSPAVDSPWKWTLLNFSLGEEVYSRPALRLL